MTALLLATGPALAGITNVPAHPESCSPMRLDTAGGPMQKLPIYTQPYGTCFAVSATELVDAWRLSHNPKATELNHLTSPLVVADGLSVLQKRDTRANGAAVEDAVEYVRTHGSCDTRELFGNSGAINGWDQINFETFLKVGYQTQENWNKTNENWIIDRVGQLLSKHPDWSPEHCVLQARYEATQKTNAGEAMCEQIFKSGLAPDPFANKYGITPMLNALLAQSFTPTGFVSTYYEKACAKHSLPTTVPAANTIITRGAASTKDAVNRLLSRANPQPVEITICSQVLKVSGFDGAVTDRNSTEFCTDKNLHAVVVIGRQPNPTTGRCEFIVRNSWGEECDSYTGPNWACDHRGQVTVDADTLIHNTVSYTYLDPTIAHSQAIEP